VEVGHVDHALAVAVDDDELGADGGADRREVLRRVGLAQRAADRPAVADRRIGDHPLGVGEDRELAGEDLRLEQVAVAGHRADAQHALLLADVRQLAFQRVDVDEVLGRREPQLHHRQERVSAGHEPGLRAQALEQPERFVDARSARVVERRRYLHVTLSSVAWQRRYAGREEHPRGR
jgi:hypothetical protein